MLTKEQIAEALSRPTALEELHPSLRRQIDDDILDRPSQTIQSIFDRHGLGVRRVSRATFYRYARKLRLLQSAADLDDLLGPDGPSRAQLFAGLQNGLLYQLAEAVNAEEIEPGKIQKLAQSLKSLVTTDLALQKHASQSDAPNRTGRASAGPERAHQPATSDASPSTSANDPTIPPNPYHLPDYLTTELVPMEKLDPPNWDPIAKNCYEELWEFQKKMCIEQKLIPEECADLPPPDPATILAMPTFPPGYFSPSTLRARGASPGPASAHQPAMPDDSSNADAPSLRTPSASAGHEDPHPPAAPDTSPSTNAPSLRARGASPGPASAHQPAMPDDSSNADAPSLRTPSASAGHEDPHPPAAPDTAPSTNAPSRLRASSPDTPQSPRDPRPQFYTLRQVPLDLKPKLKKLEDHESPWARLSDGTPMTHAEFVAEFREICYHRHPGLFLEPTDDEKEELKKNPRYWLWSADPMKRAHPYGRKPDKSVRNHDEFLFEVAARVTPMDNQIAQPPSRILHGPRPAPEPDATGRASAGPVTQPHPATPAESPSTSGQDDFATRHPQSSPLRASPQTNPQSPPTPGAAPSPSGPSPSQSAVTCVNKPKIEVAGNPATSNIEMIICRGGYRPRRARRPRRRRPNPSCPASSPAPGRTAPTARSTAASATRCPAASSPSPPARGPPP